MIKYLVRFAICLYLPWLGLLPVAYAGETNTVNATLTVTLTGLTPICSVNIITPDTSTSSEVDFGDVYPQFIQSAPLVSTNPTEGTVMDQSNFGGVYSIRQASHSVYISCDAPPQATVNISLSNKMLPLTPDPTRIDLFKLDNTNGNQNLLAFAIYTKDRFSIKTGRINNFAKHAVSMPLLSDSFKTINLGQYDAYVDMYPGLFWISSSNQTNSQPGELRSTVSINVTFN